MTHPAHFYVAIEVMEEQEMLIFRGFLRHDQLVSPDVRSQMILEEESCQVPLSCFQSDLSLLLSSMKHLDPAVILPESVQNMQVQEPSSQELIPNFTQLRNWFQDIMDESWQTLDILLGIAPNLDHATRLSETKRAKRIDLGIQLCQTSVALILTIRRAENNKIWVRIQLFPIRGAAILPPEISLSMLSESSEILRSVQARSSDQLIQLPTFTGERGDRFKIQVRLNEDSYTEAFML